MMQAKGFGYFFYDWMMKPVKGGRVAIKVNDQISPLLPHIYWAPNKGGPLPLILFYVVGDGLEMMIKQT
jgi:hypothetical protein